MTVYLNISDFCKLIGRSREWLYGQTAIGQGPPMRRGGRGPCVPLDAAEQWASTRARQMTPKFRGRWRAMAAAIRAEMAAHAVVAAAAGERAAWIEAMLRKYPPGVRRGRQARPRRALAAREPEGRGPVAWLPSMPVPGRE